MKFELVGRKVAQIRPSIHLKHTPSYMLSNNTCIKSTHTRAHVIRCRQCHEIDKVFLLVGSVFVVFVFVVVVALGVYGCVCLFEFCLILVLVLVGWLSFVFCYVVCFCGFLFVCLYFFSILFFLEGCRKGIIFKSE